MDRSGFLIDLVPEITRKMYNNRDNLSIIPKLMLRIRCITCCLYIVLDHEGMFTVTRVNNPYDPFEHDDIERFTGDDSWIGLNEYIARHTIVSYTVGY